jgi:glycosyltransferase involved in cell wall biosynthesis
MIPKILFISHDAHRHGAQILLLHFLKWFKANSDIPFQVLLKNNGELRPEFEALAPVAIWNDGSGNPDHIRQLVRAYQGMNIRLVYSNTFTNGEILDALSVLNCPVITHVHELEYWIRFRSGQENNQKVLRHTDRFIACSQAVKHNLVENLAIPQERVDIAYEFIPTQAYDAENTRARYARYRIRKQFDIPQNAFIVGSSGTTDWRKGADLFIQLARAVREREDGRPVHFLWIGGDGEGPQWGMLWYDLKHAGLEDRVHFAGAHANPLDYMSLFDIFALMSREDPYPLVNLEAASLGKPVVCFEGSGGAPEFVEDDCGYVVPYLDIEKMADRVWQLLTDPALRQTLGQRASEKVRERHDVIITAPEIKNIIWSMLQPSATRELA